MHLNYPGATILQSVFVLFLNILCSSGREWLPGSRKGFSFLSAPEAEIADALRDILVYRYGRKYSISKSYLPKPVTHLSQETTEWQAKGVDIGRSFTGVIIAIHLPQSQSLLYGGLGCTQLARVRKTISLGKAWTALSWRRFPEPNFFLWGCKNESDNLLKSFKHRLSSGPRKSEIILWIHVLILDPLKVSITHLKKFLLEHAFYQKAQRPD